MSKSHSSFLIPHSSFLISHSSFLIFLFSFLILLLSCQTAPVSPEKSLMESGYIPLEPGAAACFFMDNSKSKEILNYVNLNYSNDKQFKKMLDKTQSVIAAFYLNTEEKGKPLQFQICTWGKYPACMAKMAMGANKDWKKIRAAEPEKKYLYSARSGISILFNSRQAFITSSGEIPVYPVTTGEFTHVPEGFGIFSKNAALSCWINNPGPLINQKLAEMGIPIELPAEKLFLGIMPSGNKYEIFLQLHISTATQARALMTVIAFSRGFIPPLEEIKTGEDLFISVLLGKIPERNDNIINFRSNELNVRDLSLLFNMFSVN